MKDTESLLRELVAASSRLQEAEYVAKKAGATAMAADIRRAGNAVADVIGKLITRQMPPEVAS